MRHDSPLAVGLIYKSKYLATKPLEGSVNYLRFGSKRYFIDSFNFGHFDKWEWSFI
jgi:hypothetical protein